MVKSDYGFRPALERQVVVAACLRPEFYDSLGRFLDPERVRSTPAKQILRALHHVRSLGSVTSPQSVVQQLYRWRVAGDRVTVADVDAADEYLAVDVNNLPSDAELLIHTAPAARQALAADAINLFRTQVAERGEAATEDDMTEVRAAIGRFGEVGKGSPRGVRLGTPESWALIERLRDTARLATGVDELDTALAGGLMRGTVGVVVGAPKSGKSMMLISIAAAAVRRQVATAYVSLELATGDVFSRLYSNLLDFPLKSILNGAMPKAMALWSEIAPTIAPASIGWFHAGATSVEQIADWSVRESSVSLGRPVELLCVDYGDLLYAPGHKRAYEAMGQVYTELSDLAKRRGLWIWTAAQATRDALDRSYVSMKHISDSMEKARKADLVITLAKPKPEATEVIFRVVANRHGESGYATGPLPTDFARGRMVKGADVGGA